MAKITMIEEFAFSAAHHLPSFPEGHKCRRVHGHTWMVQVHVETSVGPDGYAFDHALLDEVARDIIGGLDHQLLNDIPGLERGLAEDVLDWLVQRFAIAVPCSATLTRVVLGEMSGGSGLRLTTHKKCWERVA